MTLKMYNTLSKQKEDFRPIDDNKVKMYVCGMTVYDDMHMGHARSIVVFDMIVRYLRWKGYDVTHVTNFTDIDDKIINRAAEEGIPALELSKRYINKYFEDVNSLGVKRADIYPKASECIQDIIDMIAKIMDNGYAYVAEDGSVYFSVDKVENYGRLTGQKLEDMVSGTRVDIEDGKRNPMDFALWKAAKPGEVAWDTPWGKGRPGWHIECSAMCSKYLGDLIDIHGGGNDLIFPHHEDEILQTEAATGEKLANYWLHNGMLQIQDEKMSKSLKNFFTIRQTLERFSKEEVRFYLLNTHYRGPLSYSDLALEEAASSHKRLQNAYFELKNVAENGVGEEDAEQLVSNVLIEFEENMDDDFNTRAAISAIFEMVRELNRLISEDRLSKKGASNLLEALENMDEVLGILPSESTTSGEADAIVQILIDIRQELRKRKAFDLADEIRDRLAESGVKVEDTAEGVKWKWT
ncbi:MAG: cysteine--tRNA ligase [Methanomassiliicoccales archaeon]|nr:cysteine--tRNA ligase [Methanomassiliicoccales archaeon]NYT15345.1 cysteine--tRNA ligase [Methanomassiliicoccales archaeon]